MGNAAVLTAGRGGESEGTGSRHTRQGAGAQKLQRTQARGFSRPTATEIPKINSVFYGYSTTVSRSSGRDILLAYWLHFVGNLSLVLPLAHPQVERLLLHRNWYAGERL